MGKPYLSIAPAVVLMMAATPAAAVDDVTICVTSDTFNGPSSDVSFLKSYVQDLYEFSGQYGVHIKAIYVNYSAPSTDNVYRYDPETGDLVKLHTYPRIGELPRGFDVADEYHANVLVWIAGRDGSSYYDLKWELLCRNKCVKKVIYINASPKYFVTMNPNKPGYLSVNCYWGDSPPKIWYPYIYLRLMGVYVINVKDVCPWYSSFFDLPTTAEALAIATLEAIKNDKMPVLTFYPPDKKKLVLRILKELEGSQPPVDVDELEMLLSKVEASLGNHVSDVKCKRDVSVHKCRKIVEQPECDPYDVVVDEYIEEYIMGGPGMSKVCNDEDLPMFIPIPIPPRRRATAR